MTTLEIGELAAGCTPEVTVDVPTPALAEVTVNVVSLEEVTVDVCAAPAEVT